MNLRTLPDVWCRDIADDQANARICRAADHTLRLLGCDLIYGAGRDAACRGASDFASGLAGRPPRSGSTWVSCNTELQH